MFEIHIDDDSIYRSEAGHSTQIFANIYVQYSYDAFFPEKGWSDFSLTILNWWLKAFVAGVKNKDKEITFVFMDGDYSIHFDIEENGFVICSYLSSKKIIGKSETNLKSIGKTLLQASNCLIRSNVLDDTNNDFIELKTYFKALQQVGVKRFH